MPNKQCFCFSLSLSPSWVNVSALVLVCSLWFLLTCKCKTSENTRRVHPCGSYCQLQPKEKTVQGLWCKNVTNKSILVLKKGLISFFFFYCYSTKCTWVSVNYFISCWLIRWSIKHQKTLKRAQGNFVRVHSFMMMEDKEKPPILPFEKLWKPNVWYFTLKNNQLSK